jgi:S1-C subfamily serine protease
MSKDTESGGSFLRNAAIAAVVAVVAAVLVNVIATPRVATWFFSRTPVEEIVELDEKRTKATREFVTSFLAGLIGPPSPTEMYAAPDAGEASREGQAARRADTGDEPRPPHARSPGREDAPKQDDAAGEPGVDAGGDSATASGPDIPEETPVYEIDRREINERLKNPERMGNRVVLVANRKGPTGLRVVALEGYYENFGLRRGDVVVSINGTSVPNRQRAIRVLMQMRRETAFRIKLHRQGETFEIRYDVPHADR